MLQQYQIVLKDSKWLISIICRLVYKRGCRAIQGGTGPFWIAYDHTWKFWPSLRSAKPLLEHTAPDHAYFCHKQKKEPGLPFFLFDDF